jgi:hypothetical protein
MQGCRTGKECLCRPQDSFDQQIKNGNSYKFSAFVMEAHWGDIIIGIAKHYPENPRCDNIKEEMTNMALSKPLIYLEDKEGSCCNFNKAYEKAPTTKY